MYGFTMNQLAKPAQVGRIIQENGEPSVAQVERPAAHQGLELDSRIPLPFVLNKFEI
jgi:hypothetical protein